jgi:Gametolysin peptidase M11
MSSIAVHARRDATDVRFDHNSQPIQNGGGKICFHPVDASTSLNPSIELNIHSVIASEEKVVMRNWIARVAFLMGMLLQLSTPFDGWMRGSRDVHHRHLADVSGTTPSVQKRSVVVVRILEEEEDLETTTQVHSQLQEVLFDGNSTSFSITTPSGQEVNSIGVSVSQQILLCSAGALTFYPLTHSNGYVWEVILSSKVDDVSDTSQWIEAAANQLLTNGVINEVEDAYDGKDSLRAVANHVIVVLPSSFPDQEYAASAEVNNTISIFSSLLTFSLSMYMHELGHNLNLQHSGSIDNKEVYGDGTGYMGVSAGAMWTPRKCYNAAQHWQLGWYGEHRVSLVPYATQKSSWSGRLQVGAFVDWTKITTGSSNHTMPVLVQVDANTYLQFNRAKSYNIGTSMLMDHVVLIRDFETHTQLLKGLNMTNKKFATFEYSSKNNKNQNQETYSMRVTVQLCDLIFGNDTENGIDFAIIGVGFNKESSLCTAGFITDATYIGSGANYTSNEPESSNNEEFWNTLASMNIAVLTLIGCSIVFVMGVMFVLLLRLCKRCCCGFCCRSGPAYPKSSVSAPINESPVVPWVPSPLPQTKKSASKERRWFSGKRKREDSDSAETTPSTGASPPIVAAQLY